VRVADPSEQVRAIYSTIIAVLGPLVRCEPIDASEKEDLASNSVVTGRNFRYKVMTYSLPSSRINLEESYKGREKERERERERDRER
jgi:hypothetical protein